MIISSCFSARNSGAVNVKHCATHHAKPAPAVHCAPVRHHSPVTIARCYSYQVTPFLRIASCASDKTQLAAPVKRCQPVLFAFFPSLKNCFTAAFPDGISLKNCIATPILPPAAFKNCIAARSSTMIFLRNCSASEFAGYSLKNCRGVRYQKAVRPPCLFFPVPLPPPPPPEEARDFCRLLPPASQLPLHFWQQPLISDTDVLPLPFACWDKPPFPFIIPDLKTYMIHNTINATFENEPLHLLSLRLQTDISAFCWQASFDISADDFARLNIDGRKKGDEAVVSIFINRERFDVIAEDYSDNRRFIGNSYTITGRSITARLGADYAAGKHMIYQEARYARQIADEQLYLLPYAIAAWECVDWLIQGNHYAVNGQTPIAVIADIASAAGAFVSSHPYLQELSVKPIWQKAAWENVPPKHTVPTSLIYSISGRRTIKVRANAVRVVGSGISARGFLVYREASNQIPEAAVLNHVLYTEEAVARAAGIHALSETGIHKTETVTLPVADKYQLPRAELGDVWAFNENGEQFQGVVKSVTLTVSLENDAPVVTQTLDVDRYLDF